jgi:hypothetical protein
MECFLKAVNGIVVFRGQRSVVKSKFRSDFLKAKREAIQPPVNLTLKDVVAVGEFYPLTLIFSPGGEVLGLLVTNHSDVGLVQLGVGLEPLGNQGLIEHANTLVDV